MTRLSLIPTMLAALVAAMPAVAAIEACDRVTHATHAGASGHQDLGRGKVMWTEWWSHEGVYTDVWLADCRTGIAMSLRTHEERIGDRHVIDRTERVLATIERHAETAPAFFTMDRVAQLVRRDGVDLTIARYGDEFCGCAAAYPDLRGAKPAFEVPS